MHRTCTETAAVSYSTSHITANQHVLCKATETHTTRARWVFSEAENKALDALVKRIRAHLEMTRWKSVHKTTPHYLPVFPNFRRSFLFTDNITATGSGIQSKAQKRKREGYIYIPYVQTRPPAANGTENKPRSPLPPDRGRSHGDCPLS